MTDARKLYVVEGCPVVEGCTHTIDLTGRKPTRPKGVEFADILQSVLTAPIEARRLEREMVAELGPRHQPECFDAPIPGRQWYGGCNPDGGHVHPVTGCCSECGERACRECGRENCDAGCEDIGETA